MAQKYTKIIVSLFFILSLIIISCGEDKEISIESDTSKDIENSELKPIEGLPPGIPSFPHIFSGSFYISGEIGPDNTKIYAQLGELDSPIVITKNGKFDNLIIGPRTKKDIENNIEFFILKEDGTSIKAKEEIPFEITPAIKSNIVNLNF